MGSSHNSSSRFCSKFLGVITITFFMSLLLSACGGQPTPGKAEFKAANDQIDKYETDIGFGNSPEAKAIAMTFAVEAKKLDEEYFSGGSPDIIDSTKGNFLTYLHIKNETAVFLIQVPEFKQYKDGVREDLIELMWDAAETSIREAQRADITTAIVALRGRALYGGLGIGTVGEEDASTVEEGYSISKRKLYPYFAPESTQTEQAEAVQTPAEAEPQAATE